VFSEFTNFFSRNGAAGKISNRFSMPLNGQEKVDTALLLQLCVCLPISTMSKDAVPSHHTATVINATDDNFILDTGQWGL
jgi:hypothetical protein